MKRRNLLGAAVITLDALWLGAWLRWLAASGVPGTRSPGLIAMVAIGLAAVALGTLGSRASGGLRPLRAATVVIGVATTVVVARFTLYPQYSAGDMGWIGRFAGDAAFGGAMLNSARLLVVAALFLWWRGVRLGASLITPDLARRRVYLAVSALVVLAVVVQVTHPVRLETWVLAAAVCSLTALAMSRLEDASRGLGGTAADLGPTWLGLTMTAVAFVVAGATVFASLLSIDAARALARALWPLPQALIRVFLLVFAALVGWVVAAAEWAFTRLAGLFGPPEERVLLDPQIAAPQATEGWVDLVRMLPPRVVLATQMVLVVVLVAVIAFWLSRALRRMYERSSSQSGGEHGSEFSTGRVIRDVLGLARAAAAAGASALGRIRPGEGGVRVLYAQML
jgi:hypothetical protein